MSNGCNGNGNGPGSEGYDNGGYDNGMEAFPGEESFDFANFK